MNVELADLFAADRSEHSAAYRAGTSEYLARRERDRQRRRRVGEIVAAGECREPIDRYHAAVIFHHGDTPGDARQAHALALEAAQAGHAPARWLAAAAYDRGCMYRGEPQKYGTQFVGDGKRQRLWDVDPGTSDAERAEWDVPPLHEQLRRAEEATRRHPAEPVGADAPRWLLEALRRWQAEEATGREGLRWTAPSTTTTRLIEASPELIYEAFTRPEQLLAWMPPAEMTGRFHHFDPRVGGGYRMSLYYPETEQVQVGKSGEREDVVEVRFQELTPPRRIVEEVVFASDDPAFQGEMVLTITLQPHAAGTEVTMHFANLPPGLRPEDNDLGATISLQQLADYLAPAPR